MKLIVIKETKTEVEIDIDFPYFYRHDLGGDTYDTIVFGRIELINDRLKVTTIDITTYPSQKADIDVQDAGGVKHNYRSYQSYFSAEYKSNRIEFRTAYMKAHELLSNIKP